MKSFLFIFLLGAAAGAYGLHYYNQHEVTPTTRVETVTPAPTVTTTTPSTSGSTKPSVMDQARDTASSARDAISDKLVQWHLTGPEIRDDLARTGEVVRVKAQAAGERLATAAANGKVIAYVKAKYAFDKELSARSIDVDCTDGKVSLRGTLPSAEQI